jgi:hypothetical protein
MGLHGLEQGYLYLYLKGEVGLGSLSDGRAQWTEPNHATCQLHYYIPKQRRGNSVTTRYFTVNKGLVFVIGANVKWTAQTVLFPCYREVIVSFE